MWYKFLFQIYTPRTASYSVRDIISRKINKPEGRLCGCHICLFHPIYLPFLNFRKEKTIWRKETEIFESGYSSARWIKVDFFTRCYTENVTLRAVDLILDGNELVNSFDFHLVFDSSTFFTFPVYIVIRCFVICWYISFLKRIFFRRLHRDIWYFTPKEIDVMVLIWSFMSYVWHKNNQKSGFRIRYFNRYVSVKLKALCIQGRMYNLNHHELFMRLCWIW